MGIGASRVVIYGKAVELCCDFRVLDFARTFGGGFPGRVLG
jgi:hypothetical protein